MIKIGGIAYPLIDNTLQIDDSIGQRSTASFAVRTDTSTHFIKGQSVEVPDEEGNTSFAGVIDKPSEKKVAGSNILIHDIQCADFHYFADKRIIAKTYEDTLAGNIVKDIVDNILIAEGITYDSNSVQDGKLINEGVFNYVPVTKALDSLADKSGYIWYIDFNKKLYFISRSSFAAPFTLSSEDIDGNPVVDNGNSQYRNKQYVKGGMDITDPITEDKKGDGATRSWTVGFKIAKEPTISLNGTPLSSSDVGIRGVESGKKYYWSKGDNTISQDENQSLLTSSDVLSITYQGMFSIVVITQDNNEINSRAAVEGNSGIVEDVVDDMNISTRDAAFQEANAMLKKYGVIGRTLKFKTPKKGLESGQILTVNLPNHGLNGTEILIQSINTNAEGPILWYDVTAVEGPEVNSWSKMFEQMANKGQAFVIRENISESEVLITLAPFSKTWQSTDSPNIFTEVYAADDLYPSTTLYPMFVFTDRIKYVELLDGSGNVILRKGITKQSGADADAATLESIIYIAPFEANEQIETVKFYGGILATSQNGTGVLIDTVPYGHLKTQLEAIQIDRTDTRNFTPDTGTLALTPNYWQDIDDNITELEERSA